MSLLLCHYSILFLGFMEPITYKLQHEGNRYWTDPILSDSEWLDVLHLVDSNKNEMQLNALLMFFYQPATSPPAARLGKRIL
jgi:hypothetical protein